MMLKSGVVGDWSRTRLVFFVSSLQVMVGSYEQMLSSQLPSYLCIMKPTKWFFWTDHIDQVVG